MNLKRTMLMLAGATTALAANATVIDGSITENQYFGGGPVFLQGNPTQFGNAPGGTVDACPGGSEIDGLFAYTDGVYLYLGITGNVETNWNKLAIFIDSVSGGQNQLVGPYTDFDPFGLQRYGYDGSQPGLKFPTGFDADYMYALTNNTYDPDGDGPLGTQYWIPTDYFSVANEADNAFLGLGVHGSEAAMQLSSNAAPWMSGVRVSINNSNGAGVSDSAVNDPGAVTTGAELKIPLASIGGNASNIKIMALINGSSHDYMSNQFLPSLPTGYGNLGEPRLTDMSGFSGFAIPAILPSTSGSLNLTGYVGGGRTLPATFQVDYMLDNIVKYSSAAKVVDGSPLQYIVSAPGNGGTYELRIFFPGALTKVVTTDTWNGPDVLNLNLIAGDVDGDNEIGTGDFDMVVSAYGNSGSNLIEDVDYDGEVGTGDFDTIVANYGESGE